MPRFEQKSERFAGRILPSTPDEPSAIWGLGDAVKGVGLAILGVVGRHARTATTSLPLISNSRDIQPPVQRSSEVHAKRGAPDLHLTRCAFAGEQRWERGIGSGATRAGASRQESRQSDVEASVRRRRPPVQVEPPSWWRCFTPEDWAEPGDEIQRYTTAEQVHQVEVARRQWWAAKRRWAAENGLDVVTWLRHQSEARLWQLRPEGPERRRRR